MYLYRIRYIRRYVNNNQIVIIKVILKCLYYIKYRDSLNPSLALHLTAYISKKDDSCMLFQYDVAENLRHYHTVIHFKNYNLMSCNGLLN